MWSTLSLVSTCALLSTAQSTQSQDQTQQARHQVINATVISPLAEYAFAADPLYTYTDLNATFVGATQHGLYDAHIINMTSGSFLNASIVNHVIWWHYIVIVVPRDYISITKAFFWTACADPGSNSHPERLPTALSDDVLIAAEIATQTRLISFVVFTNPNQPIVWADDPAQKSRSTDALLSYSLKESMLYGYPPLFFPMVRGNVRVLDTIQNLTSALNPRTKYNWALTSFVTAGASKWGWLTWLFAAVDARIVGFVPVVFDMLNWHKNAHHQFTSYNGWTWAMEDYWQQGLMANLDTGAEATLFELIDPYYFLDAYANKSTMVLHNGRDEFFMPDDTWLWWAELPPPKWTLLVPDTEHAGITGLLETLPAIATWTYAVLFEQRIPFLNWTLDHGSGTITAYTDLLPVRARIWHAQTCTGCSGRRDWRALTLIDSDTNECPSNIIVDGDKCYNLASMWYSNEISFLRKENGYFVYQQKMAQQNDNQYLAFFLDFKFNVSDSGGAGWPIDEYGIFELSTECMVVNNTMPFVDCSGQQCNGTLV